MPRVKTNSVPAFVQSELDKAQLLDEIKEKATRVWHENETPSGLKVEYSPQPRAYRVNGQEVPSVTTILDVLHKPALPWWGMKIGVEGVIKLWERNILWEDRQGRDGRRFFIDEAGGEVDAEDIVRFLTQEKLTVNHVVKEASDRGLSVHDAFETWARTGQKPFALEYPEAERGYIDGLNAFLADIGNAFEVGSCEVMVGSAEHGFAGRFDLRGTYLGSEQQLVARAFPKRENKREFFEHGDYLMDLKTSKSVYPSHHLQLAAYELASQESGFEPTDFQAIIHVTSDGQYEFVLGKANPEQFLAVKECFDVLQELK